MGRHKKANSPEDLELEKALYEDHQVRKALHEENDSPGHIVELELLERRYKVELDRRGKANPHAAWHAIMICCQTDTPFPKWVTTYLHAASKNLLAINKPDSHPHEFRSEGTGIR